jgi:hypothetical protein
MIESIVTDASGGDGAVDCVVGSVVLVISCGAVFGSEVSVIPERQPTISRDKIETIPANARLFLTYSSLIPFSTCLILGFLTQTCNESHPCHVFH